MSQTRGVCDTPIVPHRIRMNWASQPDHYKILYTHTQLGPNPNLIFYRVKSGIVFKYNYGEIPDSNIRPVFDFKRVPYKDSHYPKPLA